VQNNLPFLSFLKIRGSYGLAGNDQISGATRFPYLTLISNRASSYWGYRGDGIVEQQQGADNLKWEVAKKANVGIEANFLNDNLKFVVDVFRDQTRQHLHDTGDPAQLLGIGNRSHVERGEHAQLWV